TAGPGGLADMKVNVVHRRAKRIVALAERGAREPRRSRGASAPTTTRSRWSSSGAQPSQRAQHRRLVPSSQLEQEEWVAVERFPKHVMDRGDMLARIRPVRTRAGRRELAITGGKQAGARVGEGV